MCAILIAIMQSKRDEEHALGYTQNVTELLLCMVEVTAAMQS